MLTGKNLFRSTIVSLSFGMIIMDHGPWMYMFPPCEAPMNTERRLGPLGTFKGPKGILGIIRDPEESPGAPLGP
jgi:hypothetical protein